MVSVSTKTEFILRELNNRPDIAERWEHLIPFDNPTEWRDYLSRGVRSGGFELCRLEYNGEPVGLMVYKIEAAAAREFCLVALYCGSVPGIDVLDIIENAAVRIAKEQGCISIRFHTLRPGLIVKAKKLGFRIAEIVMRKNIE